MNKTWFKRHVFIQSCYHGTHATLTIKIQKSILLTDVWQNLVTQGSAVFEKWQMRCRYQKLCSATLIVCWGTYSSKVMIKFNRDLIRLNRPWWIDIRKKSRLLYCISFLLVIWGRGGLLMVSALDFESCGPGSSPGRGTALCSWAIHFILIVPLFTQVYKWVPANLLLGVTLRWTSIPSRGE